MQSDEPGQVESATPERAAVVAVLQALGDAWGRHDADAYGDLFTDDATYVTFLGTHYQGKQEITESHRMLIATYLKGTRLADAVLSVRFPGPGVAVLTGRPLLEAITLRLRPHPRPILTGDLRRSSRLEA
jgi:uncharacterized protein (TIGR02246 family)